MQEATTTAILSLVGTLCGSLGGILASSKMTNYRLSQLEKRMEEMGDLIRRVYHLEQRAAVNEARTASFGSRMQATTLS